MLHDRDIVLIASAPWKIDGKVNCHHIAERLAEHNRVLFVESPGLRMPVLGHGPDRRKLLRRVWNWLRGLRHGPDKAADRLHVLSPPVLPAHGRKSTDQINRLLFGRAVKQSVRRLGYREPILWVFLPTGIYAADEMPNAPVIYHCIDDFEGNTGVDPIAVEKLEGRMLRRAELVFATSKPLAERLREKHSKVVYIPNVAETERYVRSHTMPADLAAISRPIIGYVGNVAGYKVDTALISKIAAARPEWSFVFVGPHGGGDPTSDLREFDRPNIYLLGPRHYDDVPAYVQAFDVCIIPFPRNQVTEGSLPLKTFEYLAAGKPVVSTPIKALREESLDDVITYADDADSFAAAIEAALSNESPSLHAQRHDVARQNSWTVRYPEIVQVVCEWLNCDSTSIPKGVA